MEPTTDLPDITTEELGLLPKEIEEDLSEILLVDRILGGLSFVGMLFAIASYWYIFSEVAVKLEPFIFSVLGGVQ